MAKIIGNLNIIQKANTNILAGNDLTKYPYNFEQVEAIIKQTKIEIKNYINDKIRSSDIKLSLREVYELNELLEEIDNEIGN
jgi:hypothetical protein